MSPDAYFNFDPETGEWRNKATGYRFVMLGEPFYINMITNLTKQFGSVAGVFIYQSGLGVGKEMGNLVLNAPDALMGINMLFKNIFSASWGELKLENEDLDLLLSHKPDTILEKNGFYSYLGQREGIEDLQPFIKGVITGMFNVLRRRENTCEMEIVSEEPLLCRYMVQPLS